jgi:putative metalloenzyme radical SAM/SPASM domain maturase
MALNLKVVDFMRKTCPSRCQKNHRTFRVDNEQALSPALKPHPTKLIVETTTRCNLQCPMCLKNTCKDTIFEEDMTQETFNTLIPAFSTLQVLILNGIGEPLLHPHLDDFIRIAKHHMPSDSWVGFQSNGFMINEQRADSLIEAGLDRICLSLDAMNPEDFRLIRKGGELSGVIQALQSLNVARKRNHVPLKIGIEFVLRNDNLPDLPETIRWAGSTGVDFALVTQLFPYHHDLLDKMTYAMVSDISIAVFHKHLERAIKMNVDIRRYYDVFMKSRKTREDIKIIELVESMRSTARRQGMPLNLQALFTMDLANSETTQAVFEEARSAAATVNLDVRLPSVVPNSARKCEFVEEGCAFVSVDGGVHPCYSLWHRYHYYLNNSENAVGSRRFGSLAGRDILKIWNDHAFTTFRRNVLKYSYPYCFDCNFSLCGNMNTEEFEQDCYLNTEPCGACLWCMDMLQCLK